MGLITTYVDQDELQPGVFQNTINMKPVGYYSNGSLLRMDQTWEDSGDPTRQNIITRAPLMISAGNDGLRRFHPTRQINKYIELGAPYVQVAGVWTQVNLGTPTRSGKRITWQTANADFTIDFGGHFCDLDIELKNGYVPQNSRVAFPVGISGLTRSGTAILDNGVVVANLKPFQMYDAANPGDRRAITHTFTTLNGNPYLLLTLPSLTGMSRPVIDPTLTLQPDATAGIDTMMQSGSASTNYATNAAMNIGESNAGTNTTHALIKFDLSSLPSDAVISSATLALKLSQAGSFRASSNRTIRVYRQKKAWLEAEATWNNSTTASPWQSPGGFGVNDCEQTDIGSASFATADAINTQKNFSLTPTTKSALDLGNGWLIKADTESDDMYLVYSSDDTTAGNRPQLVVAYTVPGVGIIYPRRNDGLGAFLRGMDS